MENRGRYRSLFWPVILIGIGVIWLLANLGYLSPVQFIEIWRLWPVLLIIGGVDLLVARRTPLVGAFFGLVVVALAGYVIVFGLPLSTRAQAEVITERYMTPVDQAKKATVNLDFWSDPVSIYPLDGSQNIIDANITHTGSINFSGTGSTEKTIRLSQTGTFSSALLWTISPVTKTEVGLTPSIPLDLSIRTASGSSTMDMSGLQLSALSIDSGSGSLNLTLPRNGIQGVASLHTGSGSANIVIPANTTLNLETNSGSGSLNIRVPAEAALKIEALDDGSGSLSIPDGMVKTQPGKDDTGVWETANFAAAGQQVTITLRGAGSGSISIHR